MKQRVLFVHGGQVYEHYDAFVKDMSTFVVDPFPEKKKWRTTLKESLGEDFEVMLPEMPNKMNAHYSEWKIWFEKYVPFLTNDIVLVGHSLGASFFLKYLSEHELPVAIDRLYLIAAPFFNTKSVEGGDFRFDEEKLRTIPTKVRKIALFHSTDDTVVPFSHFGRLKELLPEASTFVFEDRGHFNAEVFPELIEAIKG